MSVLLALLLSLPTHGRDKLADLRPAPQERFSAGDDSPVSSSPWWTTLNDAELDRTYEYVAWVWCGCGYGFDEA